MKATHRSDGTVHTTVPETIRRHKSNDGTVSSRTVTMYGATRPEAELDSAIEQNRPSVLERDRTKMVMTSSLLINGAKQISPSHKNAL